ncbi:hypothetical protein A674_04048 [Salmonella enterica subsp. enterica serovar Enteritidis str. 2009K1651]|nr:hypothetical protein A674_04048 [Salmonella enterica subsp. enterica serovar Enteritidis str. 2009K1651]
MIYAKARQNWRALTQKILKRSCDLMQHRHARLCRMCKIVT